MSAAGSLPPGGRLGPYELMALLGAGGMGEVYRARDSRLGRDVAIKVMRRDRDLGEKAKERFQREVRAIAALSHPNVVAIHDVGSESDVVYAVTELLEGETLRARLDRGPLPWREAVEVAVAIAEALAAAHGKGIVHRDLKPANVFLTSSGRVKVLDFGLAKLLHPSDDGADSSATLSQTEPGRVIGTVGYMSPEQVAGAAVDARSDLFALGCVLHEMVSGRRPFGRATQGATMAAILNDPPGPLGDAPPELRRIASRCLEKDPVLRFQSADDLAFALRDLSGGRRTWGHRVSGRWVVRAALIALAAMALAAVAWRLRPEPTLRVTRILPLGREQFQFPPFTSEIPLLTDGPRVYYPEYRLGRMESRVVSAAGGLSAPSPFSIAEHHILESIAPDGSELLVSAMTNDQGDLAEGAYWLVPAVGGSPRRLGDVVGHAADWLPDGRILYGFGSDLFIVDRDGTGKRKIASLPGRPYWPRLSPDGRRVRLTLVDREGTALWEIGVDGADLRRFLPGWSEEPDECCGNWTADGRYFVFQSSRQHESHLWAIRERPGFFERTSGRPVQITSGPMQFRRVVPGRDGRRLFAVGWQPRGEVARFDARSGKFVPYIVGLSAEFVEHSPDGKWIAYTTHPERELWRAAVEGTERLQLSPPGMKAYQASWSPDGTRIVFTGWNRPADGRRVYVVGREGGALLEVVRGGSPTWSPDGRSLAYRTGKPEGVFVREVETGTTTLLEGSQRFAWPRWSPDGRHLLAVAHDRRLMVYDFATRAWSERLRRFAGSPHWSRDGRHIYFRGDRAPGIVVDGVVRLRLAGGDLEHVADLRDLPLVWGLDSFWVGLAPDDSPLVLRDLGSYQLYALELDESSLPVFDASSSAPLAR